MVVRDPLNDRGGLRRGISPGAACARTVLAVNSYSGRRRHARTTTVVAASVLLMGALVSCSGDSEPAAQPVATAQTPEPTPTADAGPTSPFTGEAGRGGPVLAAKLDNSNSSLPHVGLDAADVVYVEQVEGGATRLVAVYSTELPDTIVPVRSARETDAELLPMYGSIPVAFSGAVGSVHSVLASSGLQNVSEDRGGSGYFRIGGRRAPYNLAGTPETLLGRAEKVKPRKVGFTFGEAPAGGTKATSLKAVYPGSTVSFEYQRKSKTWNYALNGRLDQVAGADPVSARTVIVQSVPVQTANRSDSTGSSVPFMRTVGKGKATVLRDGRAYDVTWSRPKKDGPTRWRYKGESFPMAVGNVWVVLFPDNRTPTID